jgi:hypothetical protein
VSGSDPFPADAAANIPTAKNRNFICWHIINLASSQKLIIKGESKILTDLSSFNYYHSFFAKKTAVSFWVGQQFLATLPGKQAVEKDGGRAEHDYSGDYQAQVGRPA